MSMTLRETGVEQLEQIICCQSLEVTTIDKSLSSRKKAVRPIPAFQSRLVALLSKRSSRHDSSLHGLDNTI